MRPPRLVVFDLDDTLYLERDFALSGYRAAGEVARRDFGIEGLAETATRLFRRGLRRHVFDHALAALARAPDPDLVAVLVAAYRRHAPGIALAPDAARCLDQLAVPAGLISDGPAETQAAKVRALGLEARLHPILLTGAMGPGAGKPSPIAFREMERLTGHRGADLAYVADNPRKDFLTPRRRGWHTVMVERTWRVHRAPPPSPDHAARMSIPDLDTLALRLGLPPYRGASQSVARP